MAGMDQFAKHQKMEHSVSGARPAFFILKLTGNHFTRNLAIAHDLGFLEPCISCVKRRNIFPFIDIFVSVFDFDLRNGKGISRKNGFLFQNMTLGNIEGLTLELRQSFWNV